MAKRTSESAREAEPVVSQYYFPGDGEVQPVTITAETKEEAEEKYANYLKTGSL